MSKFRLWLFGGLFALAVGIGVTAGILAVQASNLPQITALENYKPSATSRLFADDGQLIAEFYLENRTPVTLARVPKHVIEAFISVEDPRFYSHSGIDLIGVARAMLKNLMAGKIVQGGSTITQQLAKILFLKPEKTLVRKLKEALLALQIEKHYSKDEILTMYLNQVYLGSGAYGIEAAANKYFGKPVERLTLGEGALLAGLPRAPSRDNPLKNPDKADARRRHVLRRMLEEDYITSEQMDEASKEPLPTKERGVAVSSTAPYFVEYIRQMLGDRYGTAELYSRGLNIYSTLNLRMQEKAEEALVKGLDDASKRHPRKGHTLQGAVLAIDPRTGHIKAMVGGRDFADSQFNRATQARRQPGSAFKPILYAAALDKGYRPEDVVLDVPVSYAGSKPGEVWRPSNFDGDFKGPVTLRYSLAKSINVVAVRLMEDVGVKDVIALARRLGIDSTLPPYLSLALGAADLTLMEITAAFATFDNSGIYIEPTAITRITDREGRVIEDSVPPSRQALSPDTAAGITDMLVSVVMHGTGRKAKSLGRPAAGKTGTTSDYNDAWFVGYLPSLALGVWVGYDDHMPIGRLETGSMTALPVWLMFMKGYIEDFQLPVEYFPPPPPPDIGERGGLGLKVDAVGITNLRPNPSRPNGGAGAADVPAGLDFDDEAGEEAPEEHH